MRFRTGRAWRAAALAVSVAARLTAGVGAVSASAAAASTATPASGVTWHRIFAINGWHSGQARFTTGNPSWAVSGGVVYLSGSVFRSTGTSTLFGELPAQARPAHATWITVYTLSDTTGTLYIKPSGKMYAYSTPATNSAGFTSLAGVSFPAKGTAQTRVALRNGWHSEQSAWNSGDPSYSVKNGIVYLSGALATAGTNDKFAVLPRAARPAHVLYLTVYTFAGTFGTVQIDPDGTARAYNGSTTSFTSLAGISYPAAGTTSHVLALRNGWHSEQSQWNSGDPAYRLSGGIVYLSGSLATSTGNEQFAVLPPSLRPAHWLYIKVYTYGSTVGTLEIRPNGAMFAFSPTAADAQDFTSLAGISYPLKS